jgi:hypothetical protein
MKKQLFFLFLLLTSIAFSQAPEGINYQAVIRNSSGNLVANTTVAIRVQVRQTTATGIVIFQERHSVLTSAQGLINMVIGNGTPQVGTFNGINWGMGPYYVNLGIDLANGINYQDYGTQQLMSVPYALYAKTSGNQLNQWRYGNTVPPSTLGNFGDFYLDVITGNVYYKNNNTTWVLTGNIKGPVGPTGLQGPAGAAGAQGQQGIQGATGATGAQGPIGLTGPQGAQGIQGPAGPTGATGLTGPQGPQGVAGTTGLQGPAGAAGANGTNGTNGQNTLVKTTTESAGANCTAGGVKIEYGLDANNNGTLDVSEINATLTKYVCNGAVGATGAVGAQGTQGIQGAQGPQGVAGANGTNGQNTLVKTTTEIAGANCATGGVKIEYGLDANNNGTLDVSEINATLTKYVCNGAVGATGPAGSTGPQGAQGIQGPAGSTGLTGPQGVAGSNGLNALIKTTTEPAGSNCANGGTKIETGLDANSNGVLDTSEVNASQTQFVCNGTSGSGSGFNSVNNVSGIINVPNDFFGADSTKVIFESGSAFWCCGPTFTVPTGKIWKIVRYSGSSDNLTADEDGNIWLNEGQNLTWKGNGSNGSNLPFSFMAWEYKKDQLSFNILRYNGIGYWNNNPPGNQVSWTVPTGKMWKIKYVTGACQTNFGTGEKWLNEGQTISFTGNGSNGGTLAFSFMVFEYSKY